MSFLTPLSFPEDKREQYKTQKILGLKIRGVYKSYEEADERAKYLQKIVFGKQYNQEIEYDVLPIGLKYLKFHLLNNPV